MPKEYYSCPHCPQTSSRRWNLIVHLRRRHNGLGQPVVGTTTKLRYTNRVPTESQLQSSLVGRAAGKNTKPLDFVNEELRRAAEYRRLIDEVAPPGRRSLDSFGWSLPVANSTSPQINGRLPEYADVGYVSYICNRCLVNAPLSFSAVRGSYQINGTKHGCNQKRLIEIEKLSKEEKSALRSELYISRPETMRKAIKALWTEGRKPYLIAARLLLIPANSYDLTFLLKAGCQWLHDAIQGKTISLDDNQLKEFLFYGQGNSYVSFCVARQQGDFETIESYFMTLSKEPFLFALFYIENPKVLALQVPNHYYTLGNLALIGKLVLWSISDLIF
jgi:hypothetical protein